MLSLGFPNVFIERQPKTIIRGTGEKEKHHAFTGFGRVKGAEKPRRTAMSNKQVEARTRKAISCATLALSRDSPPQPISTKDSHIDDYNGHPTQDPQKLILHSIGKTDLDVGVKQAVPDKFSEFPKDRCSCRQGKDQHYEDHSIES